MLLSISNLIETLKVDNVLQEEIRQLLRPILQSFVIFIDTVYNSIVMTEKWLSWFSLVDISTQLK